MKYIGKDTLLGTPLTFSLTRTALEVFRTGGALRKNLSHGGWGALRETYRTGDRKLYQEGLEVIAYAKTFI